MLQVVVSFEMLIAFTMMIFTILTFAFNIRKK